MFTVMFDDIELERKVNDDSCALQGSHLDQETFCPKKPTEFCLSLESVVKLLFVAELCSNGVCESDQVD